MYSKGTTVRATRKSAIYNDPEIRKKPIANIPADSIGTVVLDKAYRGHTLVNFEGYGSGWIANSSINKA